MKIVVTGGGSGGHITPILAVAHELKRLRPDTEIVYIGQRHDPLADVPAADSNIDSVYAVWAGKLRRYPNEGWRQLLDIRTQVLNIRDVSRLVRGVWQSFWLLRKLKPEVVFTRGGFVSVPVALGAKMNRIPYITHDADALPSLANRMIARWAQLHAVALPKEIYPYPKDKMVVTGVPVNKNYRAVTEELKHEYRDTLELNMYEQILFVTGGGNGARQLNETVVANARYLLATYPHLAIIHVTGRGLESETNAAYDQLELGSARKRVMVHGFLHNLYQNSGAADVIIARGGAVNMAEFAIQGKACIVVPAAQLSWTVKSTKTFAEHNAVLYMTEDQSEQPERLGRAAGELLVNVNERQKLGLRLAEFAKPNSGLELAELLFKIGDGERNAAQKI